MDGLNGLWNTILDITKMFVIPDWNSVVGLLPLLIFLGVVGPLLTFTLLGVLVYQAARPRTKVRVETGAQRAADRRRRAADLSTGAAVLPRRSTDLPLGNASLRSRRERAGGDLPDVRPRSTAAIDTCPNCGLVLKVKPRPVAIGPASGPKAGGAAAA